MLGLRHQVNASAGMARYGWITYDTRDGGKQTIEDVQNKIDITTEFVKKSDGQSAGNWALRIGGRPRKDAPGNLRTVVVFYVGMESMDTCTKCKLEASAQTGAEENPSIHAANFWIEHPELGTAGLHIPASTDETGRHEAMVVKSMNVSEDKLWQAKCKRTLFQTRLLLALLDVNTLPKLILITVCGESYLPGFIERSDEGPRRGHSRRAHAQERAQQR
jgi:mannosyl-oligosaccharide glucosidase